MYARRCMKRNNKRRLSRFSAASCKRRRQMCVSVSPKVKPALYNTWTLAPLYLGHGDLLGLGLKQVLQFGRVHLDGIQFGPEGVSAAPVVLVLVLRRPHLFPTATRWNTFSKPGRCFYVRRIPMKPPRKTLSSQQITPETKPNKASKTEKAKSWNHNNNNQALAGTHR